MKVDPDNWLNQSIGQRMRETRHALHQRYPHDEDYTARGFAEQLGVTPGGYSHFETGRRQISLAHLKRLSDFTGYPPDYFLSGLDEEIFTKSEMAHLRIAEQLLTRLIEDLIIVLQTFLLKDGGQMGRRTSAKVSSLDKRIGNRLRQLREQRGILARTVADFLGVSEAAISRLEAGGRNITLTHIETLCKYYGVPPRLLFIDDDYSLIETDGAVRATERLVVQDVADLIARLQKLLEKHKG